MKINLNSTFGLRLTKLILAISTILYAQNSSDDWQFFCLNDFPLLGKGWDTTATKFSRLPARAQVEVSEQVWKQAQSSAGLALTFQTNSVRLKIRWRTTNNTHLPHMTDIGTKGLDLYAWSEQEQKWRWAGCTKSYQAGPLFTSDLVSAMGSSVKTFMLYLPLYDSLDSLWLGVAPGAFIQPYRPAFKSDQPLVFYGTSITQGGCASRPGMSYPAIIGRALNYPCINLGFSGAGKMELALAHLLAELDAAAYIIDCLPNMTAEMVAKRVVPFVLELRKSRPSVPIILVSSFIYENAWLNSKELQTLKAKNVNLLAAYYQLLQMNVKNIDLVSSEELQARFNDATVDGVHLTDAGFLRFADILIPHIQHSISKN